MFLENLTFLKFVQKIFSIFPLLNNYNWQIFKNHVFNDVEDLRHVTVLYLTTFHNKNKTKGLHEITKI